MDMEKDHPGPKYFKKDHFTRFPILMRLLGVIIVIPPAIKFLGENIFLALSIQSFCPYFSHCPSSLSVHISRKLNS